jgi:phosphopantothenoylcysteine decarboxylase / phosphopantothenate---cysteine ligase
VPWYARSAQLVAIGRESGFLFLLPRRPPIALDGVDSDAMSRVLAATGLPIERAELAELCDDGVIEQLVELGVLEVGSREDLAARYAPVRFDKPCKRLVVAVSGSIRVATFFGHIVTLADAFAEEVDVIVSPGAERFIKPQLYGYHGMRVWTDAYESAHDIPVPHKHLADANLILVAPASATTIERLASGACSDLASLVVAITKAPVVVVPSMHPNMWTHPAIARNVDRLRADGVWVIEPGVGFSVSDREERGVGASTIEADELLRALHAVLAG